MSTLPISIIIPAHNEEQTIGRCIDTLLEGAADGEFEVIVACNGCDDRTAEVARGHDRAVKVVEIETPSKTAALNAGDAQATGFPRFYLDADVMLTREDARRVAAVLSDGTHHAATPWIRMDLSRSSLAVRAYYRVWRELPYTRAGMFGAGVYGISEEGRTRFTEFPDIIADDGWIRILFRPEERTSVQDARSLVTGPRDLKGLIRIKTRSRLGLYELRERFPDLLENDDKRYDRALLGVVSRPSLWASVPVYLLVNVLSRWRARRQKRTLDDYVWERDTTSRD